MSATRLHSVHRINDVLSLKKEMVMNCTSGQALES